MLKQVSELTPELVSDSRVVMVNPYDRETLWKVKDESHEWVDRVESLRSAIFDVCDLSLGAHSTRDATLAVVCFLKL